MLGEKEKKILDLKKKNQELEKFKFVLDYKIKELKKQIEPRENQIAGMKERVKVPCTLSSVSLVAHFIMVGWGGQDMDAELERYHKANSALDVQIGELRQQLTEMQNTTRSKRVQARSSVCDMCPSISLLLHFFAFFCRIGVA